MTDRIDVGSFDKASLSPSDYAALRDRIVREAKAERAKTIAAALGWLMHHAFRLRRRPARQTPARHANTPYPAPRHVRVS